VATICAGYSERHESLQDSCLWRNGSARLDLFLSFFAYHRPACACASERLYPVTIPLEPSRKPGSYTNNGVNLTTDTESYVLLYSLYMTLVTLISAS
jgi:hypothetical protein